MPPVGKKKPADRVGAFLKQKGVPVSSPQKSRAPVWKGPESQDAQGGITFSLLSRFLVCRERFYYLATEGLKAADDFNHRLEYGNMWHVCEEAAAKGVDFGPPLRAYCESLVLKYRFRQEQIQKWWNVCKVQFPVYLDYWKAHPDMTRRTPLQQEYVFRVPYQLASGRIVYLRGKRDAADIVHDDERGPGLWLQENKTKGEVEEQLMRRQLTFDLQTMIYVVALLHDGSVLQSNAKVPFRGVRYNVVRRPLSGGRHTIVQHKPSKSNPLGETEEHYYDRLGECIKGEPEFFFMRWNIEVTPKEVTRFRERCLDPILEQLCHWYDIVVAQRPEKSRLRTLPDWALTWQYPFGVYNPIDEGMSTDLDEFLATGSELNLQRATELFPELKDVVLQTS